MHQSHVPKAVTTAVTNGYAHGVKGGVKIIQLTTKTERFLPKMERYLMNLVRFKCGSPHVSKGVTIEVR